MKTFHASLLAFALLIPLADGRAVELWLRNAQLVDPAAHTSIRTDIVVVDGRVVPTPTGLPPASAQVIDLAGKWIIPGLVDLHVHSYGNVFADGTDQDLDPRATARLMLYCGVTAYLELGTRNLDDIFAARDGQRAKSSAAAGEADIYCAGLAFGPWGLASADAAKSTLSAYISRWHPDVIKLLNGRFGNRPGFALDVLRAAVATAHAAGTKTVVHISSWQNARDALEAGADAITHFDDDEVVPDDLVGHWARLMVLSIPTMAVQSDVADFVRMPALLDDPLLRAVAPAAGIDSYRDAARFSARARRTLRWQSDDLSNDTKTFQKFQAQGISMLAGSDTCNLGTFQGYSLHREIWLMQHAGYSPWEALAAGTTSADAFLGRPAGIHPGEVAELIVLDADPLADIANTEKIHLVVHHGRLVDRAALLKPAGG
ncbi:MAG TPA: amidohydrolase family protein [Lacunisphaera sp.]|nr:amidohydrolase family protein [Lacunisphaera sp.]